MSSEHRPLRNSINLARPWAFPAAHADAFIARRHLRSGVQVPVEIALSSQDGSFHDRGSGVIRDLSHSGLCLGDVVLANGRFLAASCDIDLLPAGESPRRAPIRGRILRTHSSGIPAFGIEFFSPGSEAEERFRKAR